jgi:anti-sigma factor RsiW
VEHLTSKQVEGYSLHQLPAAELLVVSDHLGECDACRSRVESALSNDAAFVALHEEERLVKTGVPGTFQLSRRRTTLTGISPAKRFSSSTII